MIRIVFRADASFRIGSGHINRCLTLARTLVMSNGKVDIEFICSNFPGNLSQFISEKGFKVNVIDDFDSMENKSIKETGTGNYYQHESLDINQDAVETIRILKSLQQPIDWLIVDHYSIDARWEILLREHVKYIMVVDDLANRRHLCDILLDQNYSTEYERYDTLVPKDCLKLLGSRFALIKPEFSFTRIRQMKSCELIKQGLIKNVVILFGGSDLSNETCKALEAIKQSDLALNSLVIIVGKSNPNTEEIKNLIKGLEYANLLIQIENVYDYMAEADLAIGAGGSTALERCCLGVPGLVITTAENQEYVAQTLARKGAHLLLGESSAVTVSTIKQSLNVLHRSPQLVNHMSQVALKIVDGLGVFRVSNNILNIRISIKIATLQDSEDLYRWRNSERIREFSFNTQIISRREHEKWLHSVIDDNQRVLLIASNESQPIGVLRYDLNGESAIISMYVVPEQIGKGLGSLIIKAGNEWIHDNLPHINSIEAQIFQDNIPSIKAFEKAGFKADCFSYFYRFK
ncbi:UDP-2,4-diacetamido-2,4,6-trideoxy-beta-L-altropyranose hydrolase [bacterium]|nr:UDP-2,4-diacetamido-2,4,6-trideoxy-beta-L-altropyranose hydrolase [bacterium]